jgi:hypothetical protein
MSILLQVGDGSALLGSAVDSKSSNVNSKISTDWMSMMPRFVVDIVNGLKCLESWTSKVRLIESLVFASLVVYAVSIAAWPAFHPANSN